MCKHLAIYIASRCEATLAFIWCLFTGPPLNVIGKFTLFLALFLSPAAYVKNVWLFNNLQLHHSH